MNEKLFVYCLTLSNSKKQLLLNTLPPKEIGGICVPGFLSKAVEDVQIEDEIKTYFKNVLGTFVVSCEPLQFKKDFLNGMDLAIYKTTIEGDINAEDHDFQAYGYKSFLYLEKEALPMIAWKDDFESFIENAAKLSKDTPIDIV